MDPKSGLYQILTLGVFERKILRESLVRNMLEMISIFERILSQPTVNRLLGHVVGMDVTAQASKVFEGVASEDSIIPTNIKYRKNIRLHHSNY